MRTPDFLVVGAARAGTTSLHSYLRQHPELYLPRLKEPCFFVFDGEEVKYVKGKFAFAVRKFEDYEKLFGSADPSQRIGEMSTPYLYRYEKTIDSIKKHFKDYRNIKIVILLRNPVDRAYSQYKWRVRDGREMLSFEEAIDAEKERMVGNFSFDYFYVDRGYYFRQVKAYLENFNDVHLILFKDFNADAQSVLSKLCGFLKVNENYIFKKEKKQNESSVPKSKAISRMVTSESKWKYKLWFSLPDVLRKNIRNLFSKMNEKKSAKKGLNPLTRQKLIELYSDDILNLQELINRDLSRWLK